MGFNSENIYANEINPRRIKLLRERHPDINIIEGDAVELHFNSSFDIVMQSTVFTSVLDQEKRIKLAKKMFSMLRAGGIILWYDFFTIIREIQKLGR